MQIIIFLSVIMALKAISHMKEAPWIFAHYQKIYNLCPILMTLHCENDQPMRVINSTQFHKDWVKFVDF